MVQWWLPGNMAHLTCCGMVRKGECLTSAGLYVVQPEKTNANNSNNINKRNIIYIRDYRQQLPPVTDVMCHVGKNLAETSRNAIRLSFQIETMRTIVLTRRSIIGRLTVRHRVSVKDSLALGDLSLPCNCRISGMDTGRSCNKPDVSWDEAAEEVNVKGKPRPAVWEITLFFWNFSKKMQFLRISQLFRPNFLKFGLNFLRECNINFIISEVDSESMQFQFFLSWRKILNQIPHQLQGWLILKPD